MLISNKRSRKQGSIWREVRSPPKSLKAFMIASLKYGASLAFGSNPGCALTPLSPTPFIVQRQGHPMMSWISLPVRPSPKTSNGQWLPCSAFSDQYGGLAGWSMTSSSRWIDAATCKTCKLNFIVARGFVCPSILWYVCPSIHRYPVSWYIVLSGFQNWCQKV